VTTTKATPDSGGTAAKKAFRASSPPAEAHFGLDDADVVDRLEVVWPNGERQSFDQVSAGQLVVVRQGGDLRTRKPGVVEPAHRPDATRTGPATETPERPE